MIALTGASTFLGKNLVGALEDDASVARVITISPRAAERGGAAAGPKTRAYTVDLTSPSAAEAVSELLIAERATSLVHLAFLSAPTRATAWAHELEAVGTMHLLAGARHAPIEKLVTWSQTSLYGAHGTNPNFLTERHALRADPDEPYFADKIAAEREVEAFAARAKDVCVTVLRTAPIVGPTVQNFVTRYLADRVVITLLGFDPLWQFVHEMDAITAFKLALDRDVPGVFNVVGGGVLPLSAVVKLAARRTLPLFHPVAEALTSALWAAGTSPVPPSFLRYLRFVCVADGEQAARKLGFRPAYTTREALADWVSARGLRDAHLLQDAPA